MESTEGDTSRENVDENSVEIPSSLEDEATTKLRKQLAETEEKLVKFKKFALSVRNERDQLNEKVATCESENDKLKQELKKFQSKSYQQVFANFQNLQTEYDKQQDIIEDGKQTSKRLEADLLKCGEDLSQCRSTLAQHQEEIHLLKSHCQQKDTQIQSLNVLKQDLESKIIVLQQENKNDKKHANELQNTNSEEFEKRIAILEEANQDLHRKLNDTNQQLDGHLETDRKFRELSETYEKIKLENQELRTDLQDSRLKFDTIESEKIRFEKELASLQLEHSQRGSQNEQMLADLRSKLKQAEDDVEQSNSKFEQYKTKVANVLKQGKLNSAGHDQVVEELTYANEKLEQELNDVRGRCTKLEAEVAKISEQNIQLQQKLAAAESDLEQHESAKARLNELMFANKRLKSQIEMDKLNTLTERQALLDDNKRIEQSYEQQIRALQQELATAASSADAASSVRHTRQPSSSLSPPLAGTTSDTESSHSVVHSFIEINGREDITSQQSSANESHSERNFLEDILNNDSDNQSIDVISASEIENLTQLLGDSENNIHLLSEQNRVLKEEIRRLTKNIERLDIAENLEYLKNVLLKFMTIPKVDERERLITVLTTILKLTQEEKRVFVDAIQNGASMGGSPGVKWSLW